jgi:hypothetical protein
MLLRLPASGNCWPQAERQARLDQPVRREHKERQERLALDLLGLVDPQLQGPTGAIRPTNGR